MEKQIIMQKTDLIRGSVVLGILALIIGFFSVPLLGLTPMGKLFFPGQSIWEIPMEIEDTMIISDSSLEDQVTVYRDNYGIPHIFGRVENDVMFALGYCMAQDRLFMMQMARSLTRGNMSAILGEDLLEIDKYNLAMLKDYYSVQTYKALVQGANTDPKINTILQELERFADGVNYYIDNTPTLPLEFQLLDINMEHWTVIDTISMGKYMAEDLTWSLEDLYHLVIVEKMGIEAYNFFLGSPRPYQIPVCPNYGNFSTYEFIHLNQTFSNLIDSIPLSSSINALYYKLSQFPQEQTRSELGVILGSNNWVIDGNKSASGYPIICNDMHLEWNLPGIWYQAHLVISASDNPFNIWGIFLPGVPYPLVGQNQFVSWGFTNTYFDSIDWYYYISVNETYYIQDGKITPYKYINYTIDTKEGRTIKYKIKLTEEGPVFSDFITDSILDSIKSNNVIACRWIAHNVTWELKAFYEYSHAKNRADFNAASQNFWLPSQNHIYADIYGNIAIRPTGKVPIRDDSLLDDKRFGKGVFPYNGSAGEGKWIGWLPFTELPETINPNQHYLASANQIVAGSDYINAHSNQTFQTYYSNGYRARRINQLLENATNLTINDMKAIQLDTYSIKAENILPILLETIKNSANLTNEEVQILNDMNNWDYQMNLARWEPSVFKLWIEILKEQIFQDELNEWDLKDFIPYISDALIEYLLKSSFLDAWFDNVSTSNTESVQDTIQTAFHRTVNALHSFFNTGNFDEWNWGNLHQNIFNHLTNIPGFGVGPILANGSADTINPSYGNIWKNGHVSVATSHGGASERWICDWGNLNQSISVIPSGERGIIGSKHYSDQLTLFLNGDYHQNYYLITDFQSFPSNLIESRIYFKKEV